MRLIDRDAIHWRPDENWELYATAADIRAIPIVDAVVVTRCKDCEHYDMGVCLKIYSDGNVHPEAWQERKPDDFCSYGEPKEGTYADNHD